MMPVHHKSYRVEMGYEARPGASWRKQLGLGEVVPLEIPDDVLAEQIHHNGLHPRDVTASICGDPLPGESVLERGPELTIAPYDPVRNYVPYQPGISPRERLRQMSPRERRRRLAQTKGEG